MTTKQFTFGALITLILAAVLAVGVNRIMTPTFDELAAANEYTPEPLRRPVPGAPAYLDASSDTVDELWRLYVIAGGALDSEAFDVYVNKACRDRHEHGSWDAAAHEWEIETWSYSPALQWELGYIFGLVEQSGCN